MNTERHQKREEQSLPRTEQRTGKKRRSRPLALLSLVVILALILVPLAQARSGRVSLTGTRRPRDRYAGKIEQIRSDQDADGDGTDDQRDILEGALAYAKTRPRYKSRYYASGYPDDGYGVCTDLVAAAFLAAGYDLQQLVDQDIREHPQEYDIETPDPAIDYRRVKNLQVWFRNNTESLTTDISEIRKWQGGDVVIFTNHIGIVSDRRNKEGIPYVIHHNSPLQRNYEQDILKKREGEIVGHYRMP